MYQKRKQKKWWKIGCIVVILMIFLGLCYVLLSKKTTLTPLESWIKDSGLLVEKVFLKPFQFIQKKMSDKELETLKEKAASSDSLEKKNKELEYQLAELKKTLDLNHILSKQSYVNVTVINRNVDDWFQQVTIDKGKKNGIKENMAVVVKEGLIGITCDVSNYNSTVKLLVSDKFPKKISVKIEIDKHYVYGLLTGYNSKTKMLQIEGIAENTKIPKDALVTTTGLGEEIPAGIVVGYVKNVTSDNFDLARVVEVESKVNYNALNYATVVRKEKSS